MKAIGGRFNEGGVDCDNINEQFGKFDHKAVEFVAPLDSRSLSKHSANCGGQKLISCANAACFETRTAAGNYFVTNNKATHGRIRHYRGAVRERSTCATSIIGQDVILNAAIITRVYSTE